DDAKEISCRETEQMNFRALPAPAQIPIEALDLGRRLIAPAAVAQALRRQIERPFVLPHAVLHRAAAAAIRAAERLDFGALPGETVLHPDIDRAAKGVEPELRIARPDVGALDGDGWDQVPIHRIAEGFVHADAVHVDGDALRCALQR